MNQRLAKILLTIHEIGGKIPGRIAFQKTIYLLQALGMDFKIKYRWYFFGPFAVELAHILDQSSFFRYLSYRGLK